MTKTKTELGYNNDGPKCCGNCEHMGYSPYDAGFPECTLMPSGDNNIEYYAVCNEWRKPND